jgi:ligand-binding sensor domain-containing protein
MILRLQLIIFFLLIVSTSFIRAQELYFQSIASKLNLPSDECYNIIQDIRGYIWIATDNGLCRYNGSDITVYNAKNGLPEKAVYFIQEDRKGRINLITSTGRILYILNDSIHEYAFNQQFADCRRTNKDGSVVYRLDVLENNDFIVSSYVHSYKINLAGNVSVITNRSNLKGLLHFDLRQSQPYLIKNATKKGTQVAGTQYFDFLMEDTVISVNAQVKKTGSDAGRVLVCLCKDFVFVGQGSRLIRLNKLNRKVDVYNFSNPILHLSSQSDGLWIGLRKSGLHHYPTPENMENERKGLDGQSVSGILLDKEGAVWCTTLEKNTLYCNTKDILYYPEMKELNVRTSFMKGIGDSLLASTKFDELLILHKNKLSKIKIEGCSSGELTDMIKFNNRYYICSKGYFFFTNNIFSKSGLITYSREKIGPTILQVDTFANNLCGIGFLEIFLLNKNGIGFEYKKLNSKPRTCLYYSEEFIYVGCVDGLYKLKLSDKSLSKIEGIDCDITKLKKTSTGEILIGTKGEGLWLLEKDRLKRVCNSKSDCPEIIFEIEQDKNGIVWLATNIGLVKLNKIQNGDFKRTLYNVSNGILSNNIYDLAIVGNLLYLSTKDGVFSFPKNVNLDNKVPPGIRINSILVNGYTYNKNREYLDLPYNKNSLEIGFDVLAFKNQENSNVLLYQLIGSGDSLKMSRNRSLIFDNLSPNNYELKVYALNNDGVRSLHPVCFKFTIRSPFWKTWWFILILISFSALLVVIVVKLIVKKIHKKEKEKTRINKLIAESQLSALQAQMNPHFIFNAINSIQNYILKQDEKKAFEYLGTFSKLIRMVLNHSRRTSVSLFQELELLKLYVELEQLRFKNVFSFDLQISPDIDLNEIEVPAMLIQPYVENAIWHGLMSLGEKRKGKIMLNFSQTDYLLRIVIEDNGIGREQANKYNETNTANSLAMKLTSQRIEMINELRGRGGLKVLISDLKDQEGNACGTRVELFLILEPN